MTLPLHPNVQASQLCFSQADSEYSIWFTWFHLKKSLLFKQYDKLLLETVIKKKFLPDPKNDGGPKNDDPGH